MVSKLLHLVSEPILSLFITNATDQDMKKILPTSILISCLIILFFICYAIYTNNFTNAQALNKIGQDPASERQADLVPHEPDRVTTGEAGDTEDSYEPFSYGHSILARKGSLEAIGALMEDGWERYQRMARSPSLADGEVVQWIIEENHRLTDEDHPMAGLGAEDWGRDDLLAWVTGDDSLAVTVLDRIPAVTYSGFSARSAAGSNGSHPDLGSSPSGGGSSSSQNPSAPYQAPYPPIAGGSRAPQGPHPPSFPVPGTPTPPSDPVQPPIPYDPPSGEPTWPVDPPEDPGSPAPVPEPSTLALLAAGILGLAGVTRASKKNVK